MATTGQGIIADESLIAALRGDTTIEDVCRVTGVSRDEFAAARSAYLQRRLPPRDVQLPAAVRGRVEILRDRTGVPHVYANATDDLYFGLGFAMAQDRLWQMDRMRRRALGRQAEVLGQAYVKDDLIHRLVAIREIADAEADRIDGPTRRILEAFVAGINRQIETTRQALPIEFVLLDYEPEPFEVRDSIAILRGIWWSLNGRLENLVVAEAARLLPTSEMQRAYLTPESAEERIVSAEAPAPAYEPLQAVRQAIVGTADITGSNNWAVAGTRTASGRAILCSDPHQMFWQPSSWYEYAIHGPEDDVAGAGHAGVPGIWWGTNRRIAWGITNNGYSTRDLYIETVNPDNATQYRVDGTWVPFGHEPIEIAVRGGSPLRFTRRRTTRGPIMNEVLPSIEEEGDPPLSLRWVGQEHLDDMRALVALGRANNWTDFRAALRDWSVPIFNFVYADCEGFVGYQCAGRVPVRGRVKHGYRDAQNPEDNWRGYVPFDGMPRWENPARGFVLTANNRAVPDTYPFPLYGVAASGHRALRIKEAIEADGPFDRDRARALQTDVKNLRAAELCPPLCERLRDSRDDDIRLFVDILTKWDFHYRLDSPAPAIFEAFMAFWQTRVAAERMPERLVPLVKGQGCAAARLLLGEDLEWFAQGVQDALISTAKEVITALRQRHGAEPGTWSWGDVHRAHLRHPLSNDANASVFDIGPTGCPGGAETVSNTGVGTPPEFAANGGVEYRLIVDFAEPDRFWAVQNAGNSGQPGGPHYADQFEDWVAGRYHEVRLTREDVERDSQSQTTLLPAQ
jgi:penicillin amidase